MAAAWLDTLMQNEVSEDSKEMKLAEKVIIRKDKRAEVELVERKAAAVETVDRLLSAAVARKAPDAVIKAYEARLQELES